MSEPNKTERSLKSSPDEQPDLRGVIGDDRDPEEVDIFGYQVIYTTGELTVPRDALLDKIDEVGLPEWMAPGQVSPHRAFGRMITDLAEDGEEVEFGGHRVRFEIEPGDNKRYTKHFHAKVYHEADDDNVNATEGVWVDHELGIVKYDSDADEPENRLRFVDRIEESSSLAPLWYDGIKRRARDRYETHQQLHNGDDINNMVYYLCRQWTDAVKLRQACYFVPAAYEGVEDYIDGFRALYQWLDAEYKVKGGRSEDTELFAINIMDSEREREMVERKVRAELEDEVDDVFDDIVDEVREGAAADDIAEQVVSDLDGVEGLAERHSAVLKTELSVKRAIQDVLTQMEPQREEVVDKVLGEIGIAEDARKELAA